MNRVRVIEHSVECQWLGVLSLVPVIGVMFAGAALFRYWRVRAEVGHDWNPAQKHLDRGTLFAWAGILLTILAALAGRLVLQIRAVGGF
ncbi:MAG: hypothetical protein ACLQDC_16875 [Verrucomicrobiia bacterium]